jgi:hypothetical protein
MTMIGTAIALRRIPHLRPNRSAAQIPDLELTIFLLLGVSCPCV